jgi:PD-(D/E)XK nuclease superfamily protein
MAILLFSEWDTEFVQMELAWELLTRPTAVSPDSWEPTYQEMAAETAALERSGVWKSGPADILHVTGVAGDELVHSAVLAWLLTPSARHGLGAKLLTELVRETWSLEIGGAVAAVVRREVERRDRAGRRRADIVVELSDVTLVIENKVYSDESKDQCEDLYRLWTKLTPGQPTGERDFRFVLISRHGRMPWSAGDEARRFWRGLSYRWLERWLEENLDFVTSPVARSTVVQYLIALRSVAGRPIA